MPDTFVRSPEPGGRRHLGSDLAQLGKWVEAATLAAPSPQVSLSKLSKGDQEKLFASSRHNYAFSYQKDGSPKLQELKADEARHSGSEDRAIPDHQHHKLLREDEALRQYPIGHHKRSPMRIHGTGLRVPGGSYDDSFPDHGGAFEVDDMAGRIRRANGYQHYQTTVEQQWEEHKMYQRAFVESDAMTSLDMGHDSYPHSSHLFPHEPSKHIIGFQAEPADGASIHHMFNPTWMGGKGNDKLPSSFDTKSNQHHFRPGHTTFSHLTPYTSLLFPSHSPSPDHGSDTTAFNRSPEYFSDETLPSRRLSQDSASSEGSFFTNMGGAGLDASAPVYDQVMPNPRAHPRGGLGTGLSDAFRHGNFSIKIRATPENFPHQLPSYVANDHVLLQGPQQASSHGLPGFFSTPGAAAAAITAMYSKPGTSRPVFAHADSSSPAPPASLPMYTVSKAQPYTGVTLYDVPGRSPDGTLVPAYWTTKADKARILAIKLQKLKALDAEMLADPATKVPASGLHVFVDLSNIVIGFYDTLKRSRGFPLEKRIKAPGFSFDNFHAVLARGRKVEKTVLAGSRTGGTQKTPEYMLQAEKLGYEMNIMRRIPKEANCKSEQGVDEILHLKILQCPYDHDSGTIVLATGDAAEAEFSDGFKKNVERVLARGWNLELYGWSKTMSSAWRDASFLGKFRNQIRIIELDDFVEELFEMSVDML